MKWVISIAFFILACTPEPETIIDLKLKEYVNQFIIESSERGKYYSFDGLSIIVKKMDCGCDGVTYGSKVFIEESFFNFNKQRAKDNPQYDRYYNRVIEFTVMHELGHAVLKKEHSVGIMAGEHTPYHLYAWYDDKRKDLLDEFFE